MPFTTTRTTKSITIQIPEGADQGDVLEFQVDGQSLEFIIPVGSRPGEVFQIQVGTGEDDNDSDNDNGAWDIATADEDTVSIKIGTSHTLELALRLPDDIYEAQQNDDDDNNNPLGEQGSSDGTFMLPWQSGILLAQSWDTLINILVEKDVIHRSRILELGSGLGVVGLSLAASLGEQQRILAEDAEIVLTDLPSAIALLEFNTNRNRALLASSSSKQVKISTRALRWTTELPDAGTTVEPPYDILLGSDLLYDIRQVASLMATMKRLLHPIRGIVVLAVRWRKPELEREFFQDSGLEWELLPSPSSCSLSWRQFGNPSSDESNRFFHQTMVSLNGTPTSIGEITEEQAKDLPKEEFQAWERSFIQFYLGTTKKA